VFVGSLLHVVRDVEATVSTARAQLSERDLLDAVCESDVAGRVDTVTLLQNIYRSADKSSISAQQIDII
jgi:hypothetical protein